MIRNQASSVGDAAPTYAGVGLSIDVVAGEIRPWRDLPELAIEPGG